MNQISSRDFFAAVCCLGILFLFCGCSEEPQIVKRRIPKTQSGLEAFRSRPASNSASESVSAKALPGPEGWTREKSNPMFPSDKFSKVVENDKVVLSVMSLPASNDWQSNIQRWLGQVSMTMSAEEIDKITTEVQVDGTTSKKIRLMQDDADGEAIVGVMAVKGNLAWFIKLMGAKAAVEATESDFDEFVTSFKFP